MSFSLEQQQKIGNAISQAVFDILNKSQMDKGNPDATPLLFTLFDDTLPTAIVGKPTVTGGFTTMVMEGYDYHLAKWFVRLTYDNSLDLSAVYASATWQNTITGVVREFFKEDGTKDQGIPTGFTLGDPHGGDILKYSTGDTASMAATYAAGTDILTINAGDRYIDLLIVLPSAGLTQDAFLGYTTYKTPTQVSLPIPLGVTSYPKLPTLTKGDYYTAAKFFRTTAGVGKITAIFKGFNIPDAPAILNITGWLNGADAQDPAIFTMRQNLKTHALLPTTSPYGDGVQSLSINSLPNVVDWVQLELRDSGTIGNIIDAKSCLINKDGSIVDASGTGGVVFNRAGSYYVAIKHRNHPGIASANPITLAGNTVAYDFTTDLSKSYGVDGDSMVQMPNGKWAMYGGDANGNKNIFISGTGNDRSAITVKIGAITPGTYGYYLEDVNMDGLVTGNGAGTDYAFVTTVINNYGDAQIFQQF